MKSKVLVFALVVALATSILALPMTASADSGKANFSSAIQNLNLVNPGVISIVNAPGKVLVNTKGEVNQGTVTCLDQACVALGFNGATITTTHKSQVKIDLATGGLKGQLEGKFTLTTTSGQTIPGQMEAKLAGTASPYVTPFGTTFMINVTDTGKWEAETHGFSAHGALTIQVGGIVGFALQGGGLFGGTVQLGGND